MCVMTVASRRRSCVTARELIADYGGSLGRLHEAARDAHDLEERLLAFYGVGPVTTNIFLRELRPFWAQSGSRSAAGREEVGETPPHRSHALQTEKSHFHPSGGRAYPTPA